MKLELNKYISNQKKTHYIDIGYRQKFPSILKYIYISNIKEVHFHKHWLGYKVSNQRGWSYIMQYMLLAFRLNKIAQCFMSFILSLYTPMYGLDIKFIKFNLQMLTGTDYVKEYIYINKAGCKTFLHNHFIMCNGIGLTEAEFELDDVVHFTYNIRFIAVNIGNSSW